MSDRPRPSISDCIRQIKEQANQRQQIETANDERRATEAARQGEYHNAKAAAVWYCGGEERNESLPPPPVDEWANRLLNVGRVVTERGYHLRLPKVPSYTEWWGVAAEVLGVACRVGLHEAPREEMLAAVEGWASLPNRERAEIRHAMSDLLELLDNPHSVLWQEAAVVSGMPETQTEVPAEADVREYRWLQEGPMWRLRFGAEAHDYVSRDSRGLAYIVILLQRPQAMVQSSDLRGVPAERSGGERARALYSDQEVDQAVKKRIEILLVDLADAIEIGNEEKAADLTIEHESLKEEQRKSRVYRGKRPRLGPQTPTKRNWNAVREGIRRAITAGQG